VLTDLHLRVADAFGLAFTLLPALKELYVAFGTPLDKFHDEPEFRLPMPARYVVDEHGLIRAADVNFEMEPADPPARLAPDRDHHGSRAKPRTPRRHRKRVMPSWVARRKDTADE
jgi:hypothetical protein